MFILLMNLWLVPDDFGGLRSLSDFARVISAKIQNIRDSDNILLLASMQIEMPCRKTKLLDFAAVFEGLD